MMTEPDGMFTDRHGKVPGIRVAYLTFLLLLAFGAGFGLGHIA